MDLISAPLTLKQSRALSVHYMPPLGFESTAFYVKAPDGQELVWDIFLFILVFLS